MNLSAKNFDKIKSIYEEIEELVWDKDISYLDASVMWAAENNYEIETIADVIRGTPTLKLKIEDEAKHLNFLKKTAKLPI